jgi:L-fuconolactonase
MWGSDFPFLATAGGYADALSAVELALPQLDAAERELLFGGTARAVYRLPAPLPHPDRVVKHPTGAPS